MEVPMGKDFDDVPQLPEKIVEMGFDDMNVDKPPTEEPEEADAPTAA